MGFELWPASSHGHVPLNCAGSDKIQLNSGLPRDTFPDSHEAPFTPSPHPCPHIPASVLIFPTPLPNRSFAHRPLPPPGEPESPPFSSVQLLSCVQLFATPWTHQASLSITISWSLLKLMSIELVMPSNHLILCHPLLLPLSIFPSIRFYSNESVPGIRWPKYWSFSFSISPSNEYSGLISFRTDWLDLFAVQGTLKSLLQHHSSKASILSLLCSLQSGPLEGQPHTLPC